MEKREWTFIDKSEWGPGPWQEEPDKLQFPTATGLPGLIVRNHAGALCGYVGLPPGHPLHGRDYEAVDVDVHGGLTFAGACQEAGHGDEEHPEWRVCHVPDPGEADDVWWLGFDCAHAGDLCPAYEGTFTSAGLRRAERGYTYKELAYVQAEVEGLAKDLIATAA